jgi:hypothetical protein
LALLACNKTITSLLGTYSNGIYFWITASIRTQKR